MFKKVIHVTTAKEALTTPVDSIDPFYAETALVPTLPLINSPSGVLTTFKDRVRSGKLNCMTTDGTKRPGRARILSKALIDPTRGDKAIIDLITKYSPSSPDFPDAKIKIKKTKTSTKKQSAAKPSVKKKENGYFFGITFKKEKTSDKDTIQYQTYIRKLCLSLGLFFFKEKKKDAQPTLDYNAYNNIEQKIRTFLKKEPESFELRTLLALAKYGKGVCWTEAKRSISDKIDTRLRLLLTRINFFLEAQQEIKELINEGNNKLITLLIFSGINSDYIKTYKSILSIGRTKFTPHSKERKIIVSENALIGKFESVDMRLQKVKKVYQDIFNKPNFGFATFSTIEILEAISKISSNRSTDRIGETGFNADQVVKLFFIIIIFKMRVRSLKPGAIYQLGKITGENAEIIKQKRMSEAAGAEHSFWLKIFEADQYRLSEDKPNQEELKNKYESNFNKGVNLYKYCKQTFTNYLRDQTEFVLPYDIDPIFRGARILIEVINIARYNLTNSLFLTKKTLLLQEAKTTIEHLNKLTASRMFHQYTDVETSKNIAKYMNNLENFISNMNNN
jgi:hypothetical protein